ncbi:MAG TPA: MarR family transcriptional regulator [Acidimicrobiia bacterium]|nr:MarR family transcriptional regulator [Acidimicrobiia bacterium]
MITTDPAGLADRLRLSVGRLARRLRQHSLGGLTPSQRSVLSTLSRHGPVPMSRLADLELISRPAATRITDRLEEKGLVRRTPHPEDRRSAVAEITAAGSALLEEGRQERTAFLARRLARLSREDRRKLAGAIEVLDALVEGE